VAEVMTGTDVLRSQYGDDRRLSARQALWTYRSGPPLTDTVLDLAALTGSERIVDVGCGNGVYLAALRRRGHTGPLLGLDLSAGMARQAAVHGAPTTVADAQALPLDDESVDVALSMHMLYHVPDVDRAVRELRRVVRPGGTALVTTNGTGHTAEVKAVLAEAADRVAGIRLDHDWDARRFPPTVAREKLAAAFDRVDAHDLGDPCVVPDRDVVKAYLASWPPEAVGLHAGPAWDAIVGAAQGLVDSHFANGPTFTVTARVTVLVGR
jgi:SAM-dependent methyltransferase